MSDESWERWESLRSGPDPDPIEVLRAVATFQHYFREVERQAVQVARAKGKTWKEIGAALGRTRQAVWQRSASEELRHPAGESLRRVAEDGWARTAEVRSNIGLDVP
jgi:hypothetical protein